MHNSQNAELLSVGKEGLLQRTHPYPAITHHIASLLTFRETLRQLALSSAREEPSGIRRLERVERVKALS